MSFFFTFRGNKGVLWPVWFHKEESSTICKSPLQLVSTSCRGSSSSSAAACLIFFRCLDEHQLSPCTIYFLSLAPTHFDCALTVQAFCRDVNLTLRCVSDCLLRSLQDKETGFHRGFCWIGFLTEEGLNNAVQKELHVLEGSKVKAGRIYTVKKMTGSFHISSKSLSRDHKSLSLSIESNKKAITT